MGKNYDDILSIMLSHGVTNIKADASKNFKDLECVIIPDSVTSIGSLAFTYCGGLTSVTFEGTVAEWNAIEKGSGWKYNCPFTKVVCSDGTV